MIILKYSMKLLKIQRYLPHLQKINYNEIISYIGYLITYFLFFILVIFYIQLYKVYTDLKLFIYYYIFYTYYIFTYLSLYLYNYAPFIL